MTYENVLPYLSKSVEEYEGGYYSFCFREYESIYNIGNGKMNIRDIASFINEFNLFVNKDENICNYVGFLFNITITSIVFSYDDDELMDIYFIAKISK